MNLSLKKFSEINADRAVEGFNTYKNVPITYWTTALMGEGGELCNMVKKIERVRNGGIDAGSSYKAADINKDMFEEEIGGIAIYLDLLSSLLGISLEEAVINTFNKKSEQLGFPQRLTDNNASNDLDEGVFVNKVHQMCIESLDPANFEAWQLIVLNLMESRKGVRDYIDKSIING